MRIKLKKLNNQEGLVSIVVTLFVISILTLISLGFANTANREQRQALDEQLSTQAFYAAESGINKAVKDVRDGAPTSTDCVSPTPLASDTTVATTCVIVDREPLGSLVMDEVTPNESSLLQINPAPGTSLKTMTINWRDRAGSTNFTPNCENVLKSASEWQTYGGGDSTTGVIRAMMIPRTGFDRRSVLVERTHSFLLYPTPSSRSCGGDTANVVKAGSGPETKGGFLNGNCNATDFCTVKIVFDVPINHGEEYVLRLKGIYNTSSVVVTGQNDSGGSITFANGQIEIESAGKANDVLRTVKVRIPYTDTTTRGAIYPESAIETENSFCKLIEILTDAGGGRTARSADTTDPACQVPS